MKAVKTLMLVGMTALSLGAGTVMAQESPSFANSFAYPTAPKAASNTAGQVHTFSLRSQPLHDFVLSGGENGGS